MVFANNGSACVYVFHADAREYDLGMIQGTNMHTHIYCICAHTSFGSVTNDVVN